MRSIKTSQLDCTIASNRLVCSVFSGFALLAIAQPALAQRTEENAVTAAEDAFGTSVGREQIGVYDEGNVRGFNPGQAGNYRLEGLYLDIQGNISNRVLEGSTIHVGPSAQGYAFPAPTGIVDLSLRATGAKPLVSTLLSTDSFGSVGLEVDAQVPLDGTRLGLAVGASATRSRFPNGSSATQYNAGAVSRWKPAPNVDVIAFAHHDIVNDDTAGPLYIPTGNFLPARIKRNRFNSPDFLKNDSHSTALGTLVRARLGDWTVRAGLFYSTYSSGKSFANLFLINADQSTLRRVLAFPDNGASSTSGELRVSRLLRDGPRKHLITATARARLPRFSYGGGDSANLGTAGLNEAIQRPEPAFTFTELTRDRTSQVSAGLAYGLAWQGLGEVTLGAQRTRYIKTVTAPGIAPQRGLTDATLPYATATVPLTKGLSLYGSFVRGLEDSGTAPGFAANANVVLPAIRTRQYDVGFRIAPVEGTVLILGAYDIAKPYIDLDSGNIFRTLGQETHKGIEASLTSNVTKNLRIVAGGVFQRARVNADPAIAQPVGPRPVGQPARRTRFNVNWTLPAMPALSLDGYVNHDSNAVGTVDNAVVAPGSTRLGVGMRYRFKLGGKDVTARAQLFNIFNAYQLVPFGSGVYRPNTGRNATFYITADL